MVSSISPEKISLYHRLLDIAKNLDKDRENLASLLQSVINQQSAIRLYYAERHCPDASWRIGND